MNNLLSSCCNMRQHKGVAWGHVFVGCLLIPLAQACEQNRLLARVKDPLSEVRVLSAEEEQRLRLRLEYLASALRLRMKGIGYDDILQIELEVARVLRAMATPVLSHLWFDIKKYTWMEDHAVMVNQQLKPLEKLSSTLKTRRYENHWFHCKKNHLFVSENRGDCIICFKEDKEAELSKEMVTEKKQESTRKRLSTSYQGNNQRNRQHQHVQDDPRDNYMREVHVTDFRWRNRGNNRQGRGQYRGGYSRGRGQGGRGQY